MGSNFLKFLDKFFPKLFKIWLNFRQLHKIRLNKQNYIRDIKSNFTKTNCAFTKLAKLFQKI